MMYFHRAETNEEIFRIKDPVNHKRWTACGFSANGNFILSGSAIENEHNLSIWDAHLGTLIKILEGPKEGVLYVAWHPLRPVIASVSTFGTVFIWTVPRTVGLLVSTCRYCI